METVLIVVHLMIVVSLVGVVLLQRSEGGGLGIGGGGGGGAMTARGAGSLLTRATGILAAGFFITSLSLGILARYEDPSAGVLNQIPTIESDGQGILNQLGGADTTETPAAPSDDGTSVPTGN